MDNGKIKVTLLGDSIRLRYTSEVQELLGDEFEVFSPAENCRFAKYMLRGLFDWESGMRGSRIVHFNAGLWDLCDLYGDGCFSTEEEYTANILRVTNLLLSRYEKVIFATTTPVSEKSIYNNNRNIRRYNELIVPQLRERGVIINDLHSLIAEDLEGNISEDNIHLSKVGSSIAAKAVAEVIRAVRGELGERPSVSGRCEDQGEVGAPIVEG